MSLEVRAKSTDPHESHEAAAKTTANQARLRAARDVVIEILAEMGPLTDREIKAHWPERWGAPSCDSLPRMGRLYAVQDGTVVQIGKKKNPDSNFTARIWAVA